MSDENNQKLEKLVNVLNEMISNCEIIKYDEFNKVFKVKNKEQLRKLESEVPEVGICKYDTEDEEISTLSIIATITDILVGKRLAFSLEEDGTLSKVEWYKSIKDDEE